MKAKDLAKKRCIPCEGGIPPLKGRALKQLLAAVDNDWKLVKQHHLEKEYKFEDFREALDFTNRVVIVTGAAQGIGAITAGLTITNPGSIATRALIALAVEVLLAAGTIGYLRRRPAPSQR